MAINPLRVLGASDLRRIIWVLRILYYSHVNFRLIDTQLPRRALRSEREQREYLWVLLLAMRQHNVTQAEIDHWLGGDRENQAQ